MSTSIDNRVVKMEFDNANFEKNAQTTLGTLDNLKKKTDFTDTVKEFEKLSGASRSVTFDSLNSSVNTVKASFSAMQVAAYTALSNIVTKAQEAGNQLVKSLSLDNITVGWSKYGELTKSSATMIAQGFDEALVDEQIKELQWFADETSYSLTDMTDNVSKFTAAGLGLEESAQAMEGIALWAALSGQNATTASRAMYQLSQAISAGTMRLADYKSIQTANMDTQEFRQKCLDAAVAAGTLTESVDDLGNTIYITTTTGKSFDVAGFTSELTESAWLTKDVMMTVFQDYSGGVDQIMAYAEEKGLTASQAIQELSGSMDEFQLKAFLAGQEARTLQDAIDSVKDAASSQWSSIFRTIFGGTSDSITLWTDLANRLWDIFVGPIYGINEILSTDNLSWANLDGRAQLIKGFVAALDGISNVQAEISSAFEEVFGAIDGKKLLEWTNAFKKAMIAFRDFTTENEDLHTLLVGIASAMKAVLGVVVAVFKFVTPIAKAITSLVYTLAIDLASLITKVVEFAEEGTLFSKILDGIQNGLVWVVDKIKELYSVLKEDVVIPAFEKIKEWLDEIVKKFENYEGVFGKFHRAWDSASEAISDFYKKSKDNISKFSFNMKTDLNAAGEAISNGPFGKALEYLDTLFDRLATGTFPLILQLLDDLGTDVMSLGRIFVGVVTGDFDTVVDEFNAIKKRLTNLIDEIVELIFGVSDITTKFRQTIGTTLDDVSEDTKNSKLYKILSGMWDAFSKLLDLIAAIFQAAAAVFNYIGETLKGLDLVSISNIVAGIGIGKLAKSLSAAIQEIKNTFANVSSGPKSIVAALKEVKSALVEYQKDLKADALKKIGAAILEIAAAMFILAQIDSEKLGGVCAAMAEVTAIISGLYFEVSKLNSIGDNTTNGAAKGLLNSIAIGNTVSKLARTMLVIAGAMWILGSIDTDTLKNSEIALGEIAVIISAMYAVISRLKTNGSVVKAGAAIDELAGAIFVIAIAMRILAPLDITQLSATTGALGAIIGGLVYSLNKVDEVKDPSIKAASLVEMSAACLIIAVAMKKLAKMSITQMAVAAGGLGAVVSGLVVAINLIPGGKNAIKKASALTIMSAGLVAMALSLRILNGIRWDSMLLGVAALGALMASLMFTTKNMKIQNGGAFLMMSAGLMIMANALRVIGNMEIEEIGAGVIALGAAMAILLASAVVAEKVYVGIEALAIAMAALGVAAYGVGKGILAYSKALKNMETVSPKAAENLAKSFGTMIDVFIESMPGINKALLLMLEQAIEFLANNSKEIAVALTSVITNIVLKSLNDLPDLAETFLTVILDVLNKVIEYLPAIITKIFDIIVMIIRGVGERLPELIDSVFYLLTQLFKGVTDAFKNTDFAIWRTGLEGIGIIAAIMAAVAAVGPLTVPAMMGLVGAMAFIAELGGFAMALGALNDKYPNIAVFIEKSYPLVTAMAKVIGGMLGAFTGSFTGEAVSNMSSGLITLAKNLSKFIDEMQPFFDGLALIPDGVLTSGKKLVGLLMLFTAEEFLNSILTVTRRLLPGLTGNSDITDLGKKLVGLTQSFVDMSNTLNESSISETDISKVNLMIDSIKPLLELAKELPKYDGIFQAFTGQNKLDQFGSQMASFINSFKEYFDTVYEMKATALYNVKAKTLILTDIIGPLNDLASELVKHGGFTAVIQGDNKLNTFGDQLAEFIKSFEQYFDVVCSWAATKLNNVKAKTTTITDIVSCVNEMAKTFDEHGGFNALVKGDNKMDKFGEMLVDFVKSINDYADKILEYTNFTGTAMDKIKNRTNNVVSVVDILNELAGRLYSTGGLVEMFNSGTGGELDSFGAAIVSFVGGFASAMQTAADEGINDQTESTATIIAKSIDILTPAFKTLGETSLEYNDSISNLVTSVNDLTNIDEEKLNSSIENKTFENFSTVLGILGAGIKGFLDEIKDYGSGSFGKMGIVGDNFKKLVESMDFVVKQGSFMDDMLNGKFSADSFRHLADVAESMVGMVKPLTGINTLTLTNAVTSISRIIELLNEFTEIDGDAVSNFETNLTEMASGGIEAFLEGISGEEGACEKVRNAVTEFIKAAYQTVEYDEKFKEAIETWVDYSSGPLSTDNNDRIIKWRNVGKWIMDKVVVGVKLGRSDVINALRWDDEDEATWKAHWNIDRYKQIGQYIIDGIVSGIDNNRWRVRSSMNQVAQAISGTFTAKLEIHSPSKLMERYGKYISIGLANGIVDEADRVEASCLNISDVAMNGLGKAILAITDMIDNGLDSEPVIRPVLDLSEIQNGTVLMSNLLSNATSYIPASSYIAGGVASGMSRAGFIGSASAVTDISQSPMNNTFNITGDNPKEIANEVSRILQKQVERGNRKWG